MIVLFDTEVILDLLLDREPFAEAAAKENFFFISVFLTVNGNYSLDLAKNLVVYNCHGPVKTP
jgi:hypothetical protein